MPFGEKPADAAFYAVDHQHKFELTAWGPRPTGDALCRGVFGYSEKELVRRILDGEFDAILQRAEAVGSGAVDP